MKRVTFAIVLSLIVLTGSSMGALPESYPLGDPDAGTLTFDKDTYFDANSILMFVYNYGNIAYDQDFVFGKADGFYYPIHPPEDDKTVVFAAGLWVGGKVDDSIVVAIAEYHSEFAPGGMEDGQPLPSDDPSFKMYVIDRNSGPGEPDYDQWPISDGAPSDEFGKPLQYGDQTLWAVFNDAAEERHLLSGPMGIEVQQTVWGSDVPGEADVLFVKYKLYNKSGRDIDSCYVSFWADPDVGHARDDLVGCDTVVDMFYAYNDGADSIYGPIPPAWGGQIISGPVVPGTPADTAVFDDKPMPGYRNLRMTAFDKYINGTDPQNAIEVYNYMRGLDMYGMPIIDPFTMDETTFMVPGDPAIGIGWIDDSLGDRRLMATMGSFYFAAGDSQQVVIKLGAKIGYMPLSSITHLLLTLYNGSEKAAINPNKIHTYYANAFDPRYATAFIGNVEDPYTVDDIVLSSLRINDSIVPSETGIAFSHPEFKGPVASARFPLRGFIEGYGPQWDIGIQQFTVSGEYTDGTPLEFAGEFTMIGHFTGDANGDGFVDIDDVVFLVSYVYGGGPHPHPIELGDADCSGAIDIDDIVMLIGYIFSGGQLPDGDCH